MFSHIKTKRPTPENDITEIILANQWDENGNVVGVSLFTDWEGVYIVAQNKRIREIANFIQTKVRVECNITKGAGGKNLYM